MVHSTYPFRVLDKTNHGSVIGQPVSDPAGETERQFLEGLWRSGGGSLYVFDGRCFVCVSVHSGQYQGWIGKVAIRDVHLEAGIWHGWQAFRDKQTGKLAEWCRIYLMVSRNHLTKHFPRSVSPERLVYGHIEHLYRVQLH